MNHAYNTWFEAVGSVAAILTTSSFLPQALRIWRNRSARDVSLTMYVMMTLGTALWLIYGALIESFPLMAANFTCLIMVGSVLALKIQDMLRPRGLDRPEPVSANAAPPMPAVPPAAG